MMCLSSRHTLLAVVLVIGATSCYKETIQEGRSGGGNGPVILPPIEDVDGNRYGVVKICDQYWISSDLRTTRYRNGDPVPELADSVAWRTTTTGATCWYRNSTTEPAVYGRLYNGHAANDARGLCPEGWRVATLQDWSQLAVCVGGAGTAGAMLKASGTQYWLPPNAGASDSWGFSAYPAGGRESTSQFFGRQEFVSWWSPAGNATTNENFVSVGYSFSYIIGTSGSSRRRGCCIRCVKE